MKGLYLIIGWLVVTCLMASWTDRNLDFWLTFLKGETVDVPFWLSWVASAFGPISFGINLLGELGRLAV